MEIIISQIATGYSARIKYDPETLVFGNNPAEVIGKLIMKYGGRHKIDISGETENVHKLLYPEASQSV